MGGPAALRGGELRCSRWAGRSRWAGTPGRTWSTPWPARSAIGADAARYYASAGTPPGRFLGRGLDGLGPCPGSVKEGDVVSPEMLHRMLAQLADPVTGKPLGRLPSVGW